MIAFKLKNNKNNFFNQFKLSQNFSEFILFFSHFKFY